MCHYSLQVMAQTTCIDLLNWRRIEATISAVRFGEILSIRLKTRFAHVNRFANLYNVSVRQSALLVWRDPIELSIFSKRVYFAIELNTVDSNSESNNTNATFISSSRVDTTPATTYVQQASTTWQAMSNGRQAILPYHIEQTTSRKLLISLIRTFIGRFLNLRKRNQDNHCCCIMVSFIVFWL